jgi:serine/threonine protein kinase
LQQFHEIDALCVSFNVSKGMEYLHKPTQISFIHMDLKPYNMLLGDDFFPLGFIFWRGEVGTIGEIVYGDHISLHFGYLALGYASN